MINFIRETAWAFYLLGALMYLGYDITTVEWWAIYMPIVLLVCLKR